MLGFCKCSISLLTRSKDAPTKISRGETLLIIKLKQSKVKKGKEEKHI